MTYLRQIEYPDYFEPYICQLKFHNIPDLCNKLHLEMNEFFMSIPEGLGNHRYEHDKWTVKEVFQHLIDTERVFSYRALCLVRKDNRELASMDELHYVAMSKANRRSLQSLKEEFRSLRVATNLLFKSFDREQLRRKGIVAGHPTTVRGIGLIIFSHIQHHQKILRDRYFQESIIFK